jgi:hypothetical protein
LIAAMTDASRLIAVTLDARPHARDIRAGVGFGAAVRGERQAHPDGDHVGLLQLAIVSALIVESCGERFAIPQISVRELVRLTTSGDNKLEDIHGTPVMRLRDRLLPLVSLRKSCSCTPMQLRMTLPICYPALPCPWFLTSA